MDVQERKRKVKAMLKKDEVYDKQLRNLIIAERVFAEREDCINTLAIKNINMILKIYVSILIPMFKKTK